MMLPGFADIAAGWHGLVPALALGIIIPTVRSILAKKAPAAKIPAGIPRPPLAQGKEVWNGPTKGKPKRWGVPAGAKKKLPFPLKKREKDDSSRHLRAFFRHEVRRYKRVVGGANHLYDSPWFLMVGESGSGKTTLVDASPQYPWSAQYAEIYPGEALCSWWCSDRAVVLDVSGDLLLRPDGSSNTRAWRSLMRMLRRYRYQRPVDGVIVTIPASELAGPARLPADELAMKGGAILGKLRDIERMLGMQVPVYTVVTKCDILPGFRSFCELLPERRRDEMFGWSNPYTMEAGYSQQWIEEAFHTMSSVLSTAQIEILSELPPGADGDDLFLFPSAFAGLLEGTREYANQMFSPTGSGRTPLVMRGIYFTGDGAAETDESIAPAADDAPAPDPFAWTASAAGTGHAAPPANGAAPNGTAAAAAAGTAAPQGDAAAVKPARVLCFVQRLFETKIFPEYTIAYPFREGGLAKNRMKLALQLGVALVFVLGLIGIFAEYPRLERSEDEIHQVLETMTGNLDKVRDGRGVTAVDHVRFAEELLDGIYIIDSSRMISALYPSSWVSPLHDEIHHAMVVAYDTIIIKAMASQLEEKTRQLSRYRVLRGSTGGSAYSFAIENTDEFRRLREFVDELSGIEQHGTMFNNLRRTRRLQDVMELVSYLFGRELPPDFLQKAEYYRHTLKYDDTLRFDPAPYGNDLTNTAEILLARLRDKVFLQNAILNYVQSINNSIAELARRNGNGFESVEMMANLRVRVEALKRALLDPSTAWISSRSFEADTSLKKLMADLDKSSYIRRNGQSVKLGSEFLRSSDSIFQELREKIGSERSEVLASTIVATEPVSGVFMLAPATDTLYEAIGTLVGQPFMRARTRGSISYRRGRGNLVLWNAAQLGNAASLENSYNTFVDAGLPRFPERLQIVAGNTARYGLEGTMVQLIEPAQRAEASSGELDDITREIENLQAASPAFDQILSIFDRLQLSGYDGFRSVLRMQGDAVLEDLTRLRDRQGLYAVGDDRFIRFAAVVASDEVQRAGETLLDAPDDAALAERVGMWHEQIKEIATTAADPMLNFLSKMGGARSGPRAEWQKIVSELHRYDDRVPKNSVSALEDLFMDLNNITEENYRERLVKRSVADYFLARRETFRQRLYDIYDRAIINRVRQRYDTLRRVFNADMLYHFPFADPGDTVIRRSVPPEDLYNWFRLLDRFVTRDRSIWLRWNDPNAEEGYRSAYRFVMTMSDVRNFLAPLMREDSENPPELLFDVEFRANIQKEVEARNIIDWRLKIGDQTLTIQDAVRQGAPLRAAWKPGERIQLSLRWAKNSPLIPHTITRGRGVIQSDSHTVVYLFNDPHWALLRLLAAHRAPAANVTRNAQPQMLEFSVLPMWKVWTKDDVPMNRNQSPDQSRAYIRLGVLSQNRKESLPVPPFPTTEAPMLPPLRPAN